MCQFFIFLIPALPDSSKAFSFDLFTGKINLQAYKLEDYQLMVDKSVDMSWKKVVNNGKFALSIGALLASMIKLSILL